MKYELPRIAYSYGVLEPYIDARTMEIHHSKHHQGYVDKLNAALEKYPEVAQKPLEDLLRGIDQVPQDIRQAVINHGGGHLNHSLFWEVMDPKREADEALVEEIKKEFGSVEEFKNKFNQAATGHFGSGWAWLVRDESNKLQVYSLPNQDSPYLKNHTPILGIDVWEHAYYISYQNRRPEYVENWWKVVKMIG